MRSFCLFRSWATLALCVLTSHVFWLRALAFSCAVGSVGKVVLEKAVVGKVVLKRAVVGKIVLKRAVKSWPGPQRLVAEGVGAALGFPQRKVVLLPAKHAELRKVCRAKWESRFKDIGLPREIANHGLGVFFR